MQEYSQKLRSQQLRKRDKKTRSREKSKPYTFNNQQENQLRNLACGQQNSLVTKNQQKAQLKKLKLFSTSISTTGAACITRSISSGTITTAATAVTAHSTSVTTHSTTAVPAYSTTTVPAHSTTKAAHATARAASESAKASA